MISMKNKEIYENALNAQQFYEENFDIYFPVKCSFYIYKNLNILIDAASYVDKSRQKILQKFGTPDKEGKYKIAEKEREFVQKELESLSNLYQDLDITLISLEDFEGLQLSLKQMKALSFMIKSSKEEQKEEN